MGLAHSINGVSRIYDYDLQSINAYYYLLSVRARSATHFTRRRCGRGGRRSAPADLGTRI
eukprot:COSAG01_NODE_4328_length_5129_cov_15.312724_2_plen_60_part_00